MWLLGRHVNLGTIGCFPRTTTKHRVALLTLRKGRLRAQHVGPTSLPAFLLRGTAGVVAVVFSTTLFTTRLLGVERCLQLCLGPSLAFLSALRA